MPKSAPQKLNIALIQMDVSPEPELNWQKATAMVTEAAQNGADIAVLPELFTTGYHNWEFAAQLAASSAAELKQLSELAKSANIHLVGGSIPARRAGAIYNTCFLIDPSGKVCGHYEKSHLFPLLDEDKYFAPGQDLAPITFCQLPVGVLICYDLRFAEAALTLALAGAQIIFVVAQFPHPREAHWQTLLRARAIENQLFVVAVNRVGSDGVCDYCGTSLVIDPWGNEQLLAPTDLEGIFYSTLELGLVNSARQALPTLTQRRPSLYRM